ncbi:NYN domain-containing protein [Oerskovia jenensis]|uniref:RNA-binding protein with PIN domain/molecular chaperone GrpE (Heat shock protein) n=1 Tax=Oerskovia jenensis TaxID=162169 RepID=A0ABS2LBD7_9CELL|nr:NYN domain-containing protein [Oerskovia jenensis]MBM7477134.1 putative RNA-binding protein with PIN domain/molecular chaperone GrpE (heat shock protein) [Oerskovia jenensis]
MVGTSRDNKDAARRTDDAPPDAPPVPDTPAAPVPPEVRTQLVDLAARVLGTWDPATVPVALRRVRTFAPRRRAASGAVPLWHALETSPSFRSGVAAAWSAAHPSLARDLAPDDATTTASTGTDASPETGDIAAAGDTVADAPGESDVLQDGGPGGIGTAATATGTSPELSSVREGAPEPSPETDRTSSPGASDAVGQDARPAPTVEAVPGGTGRAVDLAVGAYLLRPDGWEKHLERAAQDVQEREREQRRAQEAERAVTERDKALAELDAARAAAAADKVALDEARAEISALRRNERRLRSDADRARSEARAARAEADARTQAAEALVAQAAVERREAAVALERAHAARDEARTLTHTGAELANARARLLLETVVDAAVGLRRELGIPPTTLRPGDTVAPVEVDAAGHGTSGTTRPGSRGRAGDDPALLDDVLAVPQMHLIVDGYNVSKSGFGTLTLAQQRRRLVDGLVRIASRTGAEVTCCFDGQELGHMPPASTRGVRVLFSSGEIADHLIRRLVAAEPEGRPVAVVTSDREVADDVQAMGAVAIGSPALVGRLARL